MNISAPPLEAEERSKTDALLRFMIVRPDTDVPILHLYALLYPNDTDTRTTRDMQQRISGYVTRANERIVGNGGTRKIVPGELKRTYRLVDTAE